MRDIRRRIRVAAKMIAVCLCAGVIINVAVAWGLAAWLPHDLLVTEFDGRAINPDRSEVYRVLGCDTFFKTGMERREWHCREVDVSWTPILDHNLRGSSANVTTLTTIPDQFGPNRIGKWGLRRKFQRSNPDVGFSGIDDARGWPLLSMWCEFHVESPSARVSGGIPLSDSSVHLADFRALPYRPIWFGFLANTGIFATSVLAMWLGIIVLKQWHRLRHGRCPRCAYDLRFDLASGCPECGWRREDRATVQAASAEGSGDS